MVEQLTNPININIEGVGVFLDGIYIFYIDSSMWVFGFIFGHLLLPSLLKIKHISKIHLFVGYAI